jgi:phosphoribosylamine--glycine ligase
MSNKVLVIGGGGREHALGYGLDASELVEQIYFAPGNAGTTTLPKGNNVEISHRDIVKFCKTHKVSFVVIGPETPLVAGLADELRSKDIMVFGPGKTAAQLEGSKAFASEFMKSHDIPLPAFKIVSTANDALQAINAFGGHRATVIKADGLASGKGVFLADSITEAKAAIKHIVDGEIDGEGNKLVIQKRYHGPEVSIFVLSDGNHHRIIPISSQDHKRLLSGDKGPMTGGVGVYAPLPDWMLSPRQWEKISDIANKTITGMLADGVPYQGVLYMGLMLAEETHGDPIVIEYNVRFGDPEAEVLIPLLVQNDVDIYQMLAATADGSLLKFSFPNRLEGTALTICLAAANYPKQSKIGDIIHGLHQPYEGVTLFHGNTVKVGSNVLSGGGRVVFVTGFGANLDKASKAANAAIGTQGVHFDGMQYRTDIGYRAFQKILHQ